jgi:hypothetical protein
MENIVLTPGPSEDQDFGVYTGASGELSALIPDQSVDLIFTDPEYEDFGSYGWLAQLANRVLKPKGALLTFYGIGFTEDTHRALRLGGRPVRWTFPVYQPGQTQRIHPKVFNHWYGLLWCGGEPRSTLVDVQRSDIAQVRGDRDFRWRKNPKVIAKYLAAFTNAGDVVLDPFCGTGSVLEAAVSSGRRYIGFEHNPRRAAYARKRCKEAKIPLFAPDGEDEWTQGDILKLIAVTGDDDESAATDGVPYQGPSLESLLEVLAACD